MNAAPMKLRERAIIMPQKRRVFEPLMDSASLIPWAHATMGEVRDCPCHTKVKPRATRPFAPSAEVPNPEMTK